MNKAFITVTPDTSQNNGTLTVNADKNENYVSRYATFKVEGDHALHRCGIIGGEIRIAGAEADGGHVLRVRDAVLIAGNVQLHAHRHRCQHQPPPRLRKTDLSQFVLQLA